MARNRRTKHPSTIIKTDFIEANNLTYRDIENAVSLNENSLRNMLKGKQYLSALNSVRLARFFDKPDQHFMVIQARHHAGIVGEKQAKKLRQITTLAELKSAVRIARNGIVRRATGEMENDQEL